MRVWNWYERVFLDTPDDGGGGSGGDTYTKAQVEQMVQGRIAKMKTDLDNAIKKNQDVESKLAKLGELEAELRQLKEKHADPPPSDLQGQLQLMKANNERETAALKAALENEKKAREDEKSRRMNVERSSEITAALQKAGCRGDAMEIGITYFTGQVVFDDESSKYMFQLRNGGRVPVEDGIKEELPDFLKEPSMQKGGSGSSNNGRGSAQKAQLDAERKKLDKLEAEAKRTGRDQDIMAFRTQKRTVDQLEAAAK